MTALCRRRHIYTHDRWRDARLHWNRRVCLRRIPLCKCVTTSAGILDLAIMRATSKSRHAHSPRTSYPFTIQLHPPLPSCTQVDRAAVNDKIAVCTMASKPRSANHCAGSPSICCVNPVSMLHRHAIATTPNVTCQCGPWTKLSMAAGVRASTPNI